MDHQFDILMQGRLAVLHAKQEQGSSEPLRTQDQDALDRILWKTRPFARNRLLRSAIKTSFPDRLDSHSPDDYTKQIKHLNSKKFKSLPAIHFAEHSNHQETRPSTTVPSSVGSSRKQHPKVFKMAKNADREENRPITDTTLAKLTLDTKETKAKTTTKDKKLVKASTTCKNEASKLKSDPPIVSLLFDIQSTKRQIYFKQKLDHHLESLHKSFENCQSLMKGSTVSLRTERDEIHRQFLRRRTAIIQLNRLMARLEEEKWARRKQNAKEMCGEKFGV